MKQYGLGPNGGIVTSLNLFATKFDQVLNLIEKRSEDCDHVIIDTPGQIEVFTWSASGNIITEALGKKKLNPTFCVVLIDVIVYCWDILPIFKCLMQLLFQLHSSQRLLFI